MAGGDETLTLPYGEYSINESNLPSGYKFDSIRVTEESDSEGTNTENYYSNSTIYLSDDFSNITAIVLNDLKPSPPPPPPSSNYKAKIKLEKTVSPTIAMPGDEIDGLISNSYATGTVTGTGNIGGLLDRFDYPTSGSITNSYATGAVSLGVGNSGGLVGHDTYSGSRTHNSFWDTDTSGWTTSSGGTGKATAQMQQISTFTGLDYTNIWQQVEVTGLTLDLATMNLTVGNTGNLIATVSPTTDITYPHFQWKRLIFQW